MRTVKTLIRLGGRTCHFAGFVTRGLKYKTKPQVLKIPVSKDTKKRVFGSFEISAIESRDIILSKQRTAKALIRLHGYTG